MLPFVFAFVVVACSVGGLAVGSFLNVVIYRVPLGLSVVHPGSACPGCGTPVSPLDNIPVVSWLILRGRCRRCGVTISPRYPIVEAATAALFALTAIRFGASWTLPAELCFVGGVTALAAVDLERYLLPRPIVYVTSILVAAGVVVAAGATDRWARLGIAAACAVAAFVLFYTINWIRPAWLGFGDVRLAGLLGLALGWVGPWYLVIGFVAANLAGAALGVGLMLAGKASRTTPLPYGVFLAFGAVVALLLGAPVLHWYSGHLAR